MRSYVQVVETRKRTYILSCLLVGPGRIRG
jgi:hypothetical protein